MVLPVGRVNWIAPVVVETVPPEKGGAGIVATGMVGKEVEEGGAGAFGGVAASGSRASKIHPSRKITLAAVHPMARPVASSGI